MRWSEILSIYQWNIMRFSFGEGDGIPLGTYCTCAVKMRDGTQYTFSGIKVQELSDLIKRYWKIAAHESKTQRLFHS